MPDSNKNLADAITSSLIQHGLTAAIDRPSVMHFVVNELVEHQLSKQPPEPTIDATDWPDKFWKLATLYQLTGGPGFNHACAKLLGEFLAASECTKFHESED